MIQAFEHFCQTFRAWARIDAPVALGLALLGVRGRSLVPVLPQGQMRVPLPGVRRPQFDQDRVPLPEVVRYDLLGPPDAMLRPLLDALWNAAGEPRSPHYQPDGRWLHRTPE